MILQIILILLSLNARAKPTVQEPTSLPVTPVVGQELDELGRFKATRPFDKLDLTSGRERLFLQESLNEVPGVSLRTEGSPGLSIRGSQSSARVLTLFEGVPLNFADGTGFNSLFIPKENLQSVSIFKSPASSFFGRDAMGGVLEFKQRELNGLEAYTAAGSFGRTEVFAGAGTKNIHITAYQEHTDGNYSYVQPRTSGADRLTRLRNDSEILRSTFSAHGEWTLDSQKQIKWKTTHLAARQVGSIPDSIYTAYPQTVNNFVHLHSLEGALVLDQDWIFSTQTSFAQTQLRYLDSPSRSDSTRQTSRIQKNFKSGLVEVFDQISWDSFYANYVNGSSQSALGHEVGVSTQWQWSESILLSGGLRVDTSLGEALPSIGLSSENADKWRYFAHYALGYHPPSLTQKYSQSASGYGGNPALSVERSSEFTMGFEKSFGEKYFLKFEAFKRSMTDLIENRSAVVAGASVIQPQNVGEATSFGFEAQGQAQNFYGAVGYTEARNINLARPLLLTPQWQLSVGYFLNLSRAWKVKLQSTSWNQYYDLDFSNNLVPLGPWTTFDFYTSYLISGTWDEAMDLRALYLKASVTNVFDAPRELAYGYPEPQRAFKVSLTYLSP